MISMDCPACRQGLNIPDEFAGQSGRCNYCGSMVFVPDPVSGAVSSSAFSDLPFSAPRRPARPGAVGHVLDARLDEISGLVESHHTPGVFFVHNDSSDAPRFFALDRAGQVLAELVLATVPTLLDAEDIALGPGPGGESFVYLGDTGNNFASSGLGSPRRKCVIDSIPEPRGPLSAPN